MRPGRTPGGNLNYVTIAVVLVELGELELTVLQAIRALGTGSPGAIYEEVRRHRPVAYTSVTTTLYRLVEKDLVAVRKISEKRAEYRIKDGRTYRHAMATMLDRIVDTFGGAAVSYVLENPGVTEGELEALRARVRRQRGREKPRG